MEKEKLYSIRQDGKNKLSGDEISIMAIFNNMTGRNFDLKKEKKNYEAYKQRIKENGMELDKPFEVVVNGEVLHNGTFQ